MVNKKNILVISPHPDDEAIGCGGTILKHVKEGYNVEVLFLTSGEKGGHGRSESETITIREQESREASKILAVSKIEFWREPDGAFEPSEKNISRLSEKIKVFKPFAIYVPHQDEQHPDHKAAAQLVKQTIKSLESRSETPTVWMYEVWTPLQQMDLIVDITDFVQEKRAAILVYRSQCEVVSFDEAILGLNRYRGEMHSWPEGEYAEVFATLKM